MIFFFIPSLQNLESVSGNSRALYAWISYSADSFMVFLLYEGMSPENIFNIWVAHGLDLPICFHVILADSIIFSITKTSSKTFWKYFYIFLVLWGTFLVAFFVVLGQFVCLYLIQHNKTNTMLLQYMLLF